MHSHTLEQSYSRAERGGVRDVVPDLPQITPRNQHHDAIRYTHDGIELNQQEMTGSDGSSDSKSPPTTAHDRDNLRNDLLRQLHELNEMQAGGET